MGKRVVDDASLKAVADEIRSCAPSVDLGEMEFPFGFQIGVTIVQNEAYQQGDSEGYAQGYAEGEFDGYIAGEADGKQAEYDLLWDTLQNNGDPAGANYYYKFSYSTNGVGWTDENFNPKYPIITSASITGGMALFYTNKNITDTKVPIVVLGSTAQSLFVNAEKLVTIRELSVHAGVAFSTTFQGCYELINLTMSGTIGQSGLDLQHSQKLSKASIESVIEHLSTTTSGLSVTFSKTAVDAAFTDEEWATLANTRSNWTINLV